MTALDISLDEQAMGFRFFLCLVEITTYYRSVGHKSFSNSICPKKSPCTNCITVENHGHSNTS